MAYGDRHDPIAALPTGTTMSPAKPEDSTYYDAGQIAYVLFKRNEARTRPTRVFTSFGEMHDPATGLGAKLGTVWHLAHDQTGAYLGEYEVVGIHRFQNGVLVGNVPDIRIKHCVAK